MKDIYKQFGIYRITNILDGMSYIGKTGMNFGDRWDSHRSLLNSGSHFNKQLQNAWAEFGEDSFEFQIIESVDDRNVLDDLEVFYIAQYRETDSCYNVQSGGDHGNAGIRMSDSAKEKIGEKNRINMTGKKASAETKQKMSESQRARYNSWTDEDRRRHGEMTSRCARGTSGAPKLRLDSHSYSGRSQIPQSTQLMILGLYERDTRAAKRPRRLPERSILRHHI